eukprot:7457379-Ditylum_brightwellii.AAC.1
METPAHIVQCTKANNLLTEIKSNLVEWGQLNTARSSLMRALLEGISGWCIDDNEATSPDVDPLIKKAFNHPKKIDWDNAWKGY